MRAIEQLLLLCLTCVGIRSQLNSPKLPTKFEETRFNAPFQGINMCAYKEIVESDGGKSLAWTCGLTEEGKKDVVKYDCCPGYKRSKFINNECVEKEPTYMPIIPTLQRQGRNKTADDFFIAIPELGTDDTKRDFTVFVPEKDNSLKNPIGDQVKTLTSNGRHYSGGFKDGVNIPAMNGQNLKTSTSANGLVFVECQTIVKPDLETSNGLIQVTSGPIESTKNFPNVISRLQADSSLSRFVSDIPSDLRSALSSSDSKNRFTVFAPDNQAWDAAKRKVSGSQAIGDLARQHVVDGLICGRSIDENMRNFGPTKADSYLKASQRPNGQRILKDSCGGEVPIETMDIMAGNGVVHKIRGTLQGTKSLDYKSVLECIAKDKDSELNKAAQEMSRCPIDVRESDNAVVLMPTQEAYQNMRETDPQLDQMLNSSPCQVYSHGVLTSQDCKMKNGNGMGIPQECIFGTKYTAPNGDKPKLANQYIRTRDGSRIHFGKAETTGVKPIEFNGGVIYPVRSMNTPPTKNMMSIISEDPEMSTTYKKMQAAGFEGVLRKNSPNVAFLAPQNHGWITRKKENAYSSGQLRSLLEMQTIPHQVITGPNGNIASETVREVDTLSPIKLKIKKNLDGNTFIGYDAMDPEHWSLAVGEPRIATDGVVWPVDWPLICPTC